MESKDRTVPGPENFFEKLDRTAPGPKKPENLAPTRTERSADQAVRGSLTTTIIFRVIFGLKRPKRSFI